MTILQSQILQYFGKIQDLKKKNLFTPKDPTDHHYVMKQYNGYKRKSFTN